MSSAQLLKPFEEAFDESLGRPGTPVRVYLRMMYLKFRWGMSYEDAEKLAQAYGFPKAGEGK